MTYTVDVEGYLKIISIPPPTLMKDWQDFKIKKSEDGKSVYVQLHDRTPYYNDVVAKLFVLGHFYIGKLVGSGEDGTYVEVKIPPSRIDIIHASERHAWKPSFCVYQKEFLDTDRFYHELSSIGYVSMYPKWLEKIEKKWL